MQKSTLAGYTSENVKLRTNGMPFSSSCGKCGAIRTDAQIGLEQSPAEYVTQMVDVFRAVRHVLRKDGTVWLNLGDSYASNWPCNRRSIIGSGALENGKREARPPRMGFGLKDKDLMMMPARVALALQEDGWWLRSDIVWAKPNPMPESVTDRPSRAHEFIFLLSKSQTYFYDVAAIRNPPSRPTRDETVGPAYMTPQDGRNDGGKRQGNGPAKVDKQRGHGRRHDGFNDRWDQMTKEEQQACGANKRDVWTVATQPYPDAHFATFPEALIEPCILAGSAPGDTVLDPFCGSGTTLRVATKHRRHAVGIELNGDYVALCHKRLASVPVTLPMEEAI